MANLLLKMIFPNDAFKRIFDMENVWLCYAFHIFIFAAQILLLPLHRHALAASRGAQEWRKQRKKKDFKLRIESNGGSFHSIYLTLYCVQCSNVPITWNYWTMSLIWKVYENEKNETNSETHSYRRNAVITVIWDIFFSVHFWYIDKLFFPIALYFVIV